MISKEKINPLIQADDSILIDNSYLSIKDQNSLVYSYEKND